MPVVHQAPRPESVGGSSESVSPFASSRAVAPQPADAEHLEILERAVTVALSPLDYANATAWGDALTAALCSLADAIAGAYALPGAPVRWRAVSYDAATIAAPVVGACTMRPRSACTTPARGTCLRGSIVGEQLLGADPAVLVTVTSATAEPMTDDALRTAFGLTAREIEVARLMAEGLSNSEIAARLGVKFFTARNHVERTLAKLGVSSRHRVGPLLRNEVVEAAA